MPDNELKEMRPNKGMRGCQVSKGYGFRFGQCINARQLAAKPTAKGEPTTKLLYFSSSKEKPPEK
jgi:hypothetical protein